MKLWKALLPGILAGLAGCSADTVAPVESSSSGLTPIDGFANAVSGSIRTTFVPPATCAGGSSTNCNTYNAKADVYLTGGPQNLEAGTYFFKVTNPNGAVLLSSDAITERIFSVDASGNFDYLGATHTVSTIGSHDRIAMAPFDDTPNNGGVYKAWACLYDAATSTDDQTADCKTDNFKVNGTECVGDQCDPPELLTRLDVLKFFDANRDGIQQGGEPNLTGWKFSVARNLGLPFDALTSYSALNPQDDYVVAEYAPDQSNWTPSTATSFAFTLGEQPVTVTFGNYCSVAANAHTIGFWGNKNGQAQINDGGNSSELATLSTAFYLRRADGVRVQFTASQYNDFNKWLQAATATNMQYMLSAQLAATWLSREAYGPYDFYVPVSPVISTPGGVMLLSELFSRAATLLNVSGNLVIGAAHPNRAYAEALKNAFDYVNNGGLVTPLTPCAFTFTANPTPRFP